MAWSKKKEQEMGDSVVDSGRIHDKIDNSAAMNLLGMFTSSSSPEDVVYSFRNLPPEFVAAVLARYSRSHKPIKTILLDCLVDADIVIHDARLKNSKSMRDSLINSKKVRTLHEKYTIDFGHDSIRKLADGIAIAIDKLSVFAAAFIRSNCRSGIQFIERSTRYQKNFLEKSNNMNFRAMLPSGDKFDNIGDLHLAYCATAFDTAKAVYEHLLGALEEAYPYADVAAADKFTSESDWRQWIKNRALDNARYLLPATAITGLGIVANATAINELITKLVNHPSPELNALAYQIYNAAACEAPTLIRRPNLDMLRAKRNMLMDSDIARMRSHITKSIAEFDLKRLRQPSTVDDICALNIDRPHVSTEDMIRLVASTIIARNLAMPVEAVYNWMINYVRSGNVPKEFLTFSEMPDSPAVSDIDFALKIIYKYSGQYTKDGKIVSARATRVRKLGVTEDGNDKIEVIGYEKLPKEFELFDLTFDIVLDYGAMRDLNTHSHVTRIDYKLMPAMGYALPDDYAMLPEKLQEMFGAVFDMSVKVWEALVNQPEAAALSEYAACNMWNIRQLIHANLRELDYLINTRTRWSGHFSYRRMAKMMYLRMSELWPTLSRIMSPDLNIYRLGRIVKEVSPPMESRDEARTEG